MAEVKAQLNRIRIAPRKVRAVVNLVKGKNITDALGQLEHFVKRSSPALIKLVNSAVANAENNYNMIKENLFIKDFVVNEGTKLKRFKAKGFGRASLIQKKTSLIKVILAERVSGLKRQIDKKEARKAEPDQDRPQDVQKEKRPEVKTEIGKKSNVLGGLGKRIFRRKQV